MTKDHHDTFLWNTGNWRSVPGFPGLEASYGGRLRWGKEARESRIIRNHRIGPCGSYNVRIPEAPRPDYQVGKLVALAWIGPMPKGELLRYLDGNPLNHHAANLAYGTKAEHAADQQARVDREEAAGAPTHCDNGHRYLPRWIGGFGERVCPQCQRPESSKRADRACHDCGIVMSGVLRTHKYCDDCRDGRKSKPKVWKPRSWTCETCHRTTTTTNPGRLPRQCEDCLPRPGSKPRIGTCETCNEKFEFTRGGPIAKRCESCRSNPASKPREAREYSCTECQNTATTTKPGPLPKYCEDCHRERNRERRRAKPRTLTCEWCGKQEQVSAGGKIPVVCTECRPAYKRQLQSEAQKRYVARKSPQFIKFKRSKA